VADDDFIVHHAKGSESALTDYAPLVDPLPPNGSLAIHSRGIPSGVPSQEALPMFNVEWDGQGVIAGLGWTGPWQANFQRDKEAALQVRAGMDRTYLVLHPGEEIRSPRVLLLFWMGERNRAQNLWRRLILAHYSPRPGGKPFAGLIGDANWGSWMPADKHIAQLQWWGDNDMPVDCYWMDAGWTDMSRGWAAHQSQQVPDKNLFPNGLQPVSGAAHNRGMKFLLWFVPESAWPGVGIVAEHPEWLPKPFSCKEYGDQVFYGLDHGNPPVNRFMIDHFSKIIADYGIDVFRQDGTNIWPEDTSSDRAGISQIRFIEGFYAFWDGLLKNHPSLLIDNCACGGRKLDLETIRRSIVLWRSDCQASGLFDPISSQVFNQGLFPWIPLSAGAVPMGSPVSAYAMRSAYCPAMVLAWPMVNITDLEKERWSRKDVGLLRRLLKEYVAVRPYTFGDYYPLAPHSLEQTVWAAWQFDRPDLGEGMVQAFRRPESVDKSIRATLRGLDADAVYTLTNLDVADTTEMTGRELLDSGIPIAINDQPGSAVITYKKKSSGH
jgi:alpha-galactosidase